MVVRAKRLVFSLVRDCTGYWSADTPFGPHSYDITNFGDGCIARSHFGEIVVIGKTAPYDQCEAVCQADFDRRWMDATEVPDLIWEDRSPCSCESTCEQYEIWDESDDDGPDFHAMQADGDWSDNYNSRELAQAACNAHNRDYILGSPAATEGAA